MMKRFLLLVLAMFVLTTVAVENVSAQKTGQRKTVRGGLYEWDGKEWHPIVGASASDARQQGGTVDNSKVNIVDGQQGTTGGTTIGDSVGNGGYWVYYYRVRYFNGKQHTSCIPYKRVWVTNDVTE
ncbi:MAG: hypothetical protein LBC20_12680 [Planctomycetaceae bacterium]|jgi:hypothetical protein|nr:hypothetical protein [Planctomycetaceae bacterium]